MRRFQSLLIDIGALALLAFAFISLIRLLPAQTPAATINQTASATGGTEATTTPATSTPITRATSTIVNTPKPQKRIVVSQAPDLVARINNPYSSAPESFTSINTEARAALVNILCMPRGGSLRPISGSGMLIDPRGVILTNAHVAQYVLLSQSPDIDLTCMIRTGAPALARYSAEILYIPPVWVAAHAADILNDHPVGSGEHDYALLLITRTLDGSALPPAFPYLPFDVRENVAFQDDQILAASYPAEFLGGFAAQNSLYPVTTVTIVQQLLTFATKSVDLLSLGGIIEAQSGSSGGGVVNAWGRLVGIIATTSEGGTTALRDLRAITLSYISRDLAAQSQFDLPAILGGDVGAQAQDFNARVSPGLIAQFVDRLKQR